MGHTSLQHADLSFLSSAFRMSARCCDVNLSVCKSARRIIPFLFLKVKLMRAILYFVARILGDLNAVKRGKVGKRSARRAAGKVTGWGLRKFLK